VVPSPPTLRWRPVEAASPPETQETPPLRRRPPFHLHRRPRAPAVQPRPCLTPALERRRCRRRPRGTLRAAPPRPHALHPLSTRLSRARRSSPSSACRSSRHTAVPAPAVPAPARRRRRLEAPSEGPGAAPADCPARAPSPGRACTGRSVCRESMEVTHGGHACTECAGPVEFTCAQGLHRRCALRIRDLCRPGTVCRPGPVQAPVTYPPPMLLAAGAARAPAAGAPLSSLSYAHTPLTYRGAFPEGRPLPGRGRGEPGSTPQGRAWQRPAGERHAIWPRCVKAVRGRASRSTCGLVSTCGLLHKALVVRPYRVERRGGVEALRRGGAEAWRR
jgi:hypothetical protein